MFKNKTLILKVLVVLMIAQTILTGAIPAKASTNNSNMDNAIVKARKQMLAEFFGWTLEGDWTLDEMSSIFKAAVSLEAYIETTTHVNGQDWIRQNVGTVTFHHQTVVNELLSAHIALPTRDIYLLNRDVPSDRATRFILHEMAHMIDNGQGGKLPASFVGGGPSEQMVADLGGHPEACTLKFYCPQDYVQKVTGPESWKQGAYGNNSVADDFADTFTFAVLDPEQVPPQRLAWMANFVRSVAN